MDNDYIYFFLHIGKTGGSTLEKHVRKSYSKGEYLELNYRALKLDESVNEYKKIYTATEKYISKLSEKKKRKIKFVYGHLMPYGIHKLFNNEYRYITMTRDPLKRTVSNYNYLRKLYEFEENPTDQMYTMYFLVEGKVPTFEEWFKNKFITKHGGIGNQTYKNVFKINGFLKDNNYEKMLKKFYHIGILEDERDMLYFYKLLGVKKYFINQNVSKKFVKAKNLKNKTKYKSSLKEGYKIYRLAKKLSSKNKSSRRYKYIVLTEKLKRSIYLPFTQIVFDLRGLYASIKERIKYKWVT